MNESPSQFDPGFVSPVWLLVGLIAVIAVLLLELGARRRRQQALREFAAPHLVAVLTASVSFRRRLIKRIFLLTGIAFLFIAMARPHLYIDWREETRSGLDILLAVDCSKSMLTEDVKPSRLERAQLAISDFADRLPDNRLGLIAFAGDAFLQCPLTIDRDAFQAAVRELDTDTIPRPGTDIATAIQQAVQALSSQPNNLKILILISDGEDLEGRDIDAAKTAAQAGLKIYTVGVGTPAGGRIPERDDAGLSTFHRDAENNLVESKLDESKLREIARVTGGAYVQMGQRGEGLDEIYNRYIAPLPKADFEARREKVPIESFEWPLALAILFLIAEFMTNERAKNPPPDFSGEPRRKVRRRNRVVPVAASTLVAVTLLMSSAARAASTTTADQAYKSGKYQDALQDYKKASESAPDRDDLQYNVGDAAYKAGEFKQAEQAFRDALDTPDLKLQENTYYNLGNTQFRHGEALEKVDRKKAINLWQQALTSYESSMKLKPSADAQHNYEVVKKKLEELKKQQAQAKKNKKKKGEKDKSDQKDPGKDPDGQDGQSDANQQGKGQNGENSEDEDEESEDGQGKKPGDKKTDQDKDKDKEGEGQKPDDSKTKAYSGTRAQDKADPGMKSRQEAEDLLDSLKDDEKHVTARTLNRNNGTPPPPASGKDW